MSSTRSTPAFAPNAGAFHDVAAMAEAAADQDGHAARNCRNRRRLASTRRVDIIPSLKKRTRQICFCLT
jgi:hypothetical protein